MSLVRNSFVKAGFLQPGMSEGEGRGLCSASIPLVPSGLLHSMPFLHQPLTLCVTELENKMGFVFSLWSVNALRLGTSVGKSDCGENEKVELLSGLTKTKCHASHKDSHKMGLELCFAEMTA